MTAARSPTDAAAGARAEPQDGKPGTAASQPFTVRLPGFVGEDVVGLGDVVSRVATGVGFRGCGGCARRSAQMNHWIQFSGRRRG